MQSLWPTLLAVLVYLSSALGLTPGAQQASSPIGEPGTTASVQYTPSAPAVTYPGATEVMAYYAERSAGDPTPYNSLSRAAQAMTTVIPFAYKVDAQGRISGRINQKMLNLARARGLKVLALVHNAGSGRFDSSLVHAFLASPLARSRAIDGLLSLLVQTGLDGINLDLERIPPGDRWNLIAFVRDLSTRLRPRHFLVTASVPAKTYDDGKSLWSGAYDYRALNAHLDQVILMTYDEHVAGEAPGPVASIKWVDSVVRYALTAFPRQKIVLGLPAYGYVWSAQGDWAINFKQAANLLSRHGIGPSWDYVAQVPYFLYVQGGVTHKVWYENNRSASVKTDLVRKYGLRGVAVWRLGYEDPALWSVLAGKLA